MANPEILIVDDNALNLELARDLLEMASYCVRTADDGVSGVAEALKNPPDLILMDMRMPGMSGLEALLELKKSDSTRDIPVIVLTASVMAGEQDRLLNAGFDGFMEKPISTASFADDVGSFLKN